MMNKTLSKLGLGALVLVVLLALVVNVLAAPAQQQTAADRTISVSGTGTVYGTPDIAYIELGVNLINADVNAAFNDANQRMEAVREALLALGIAREDLQTTNISMYLNTGYDPQSGMPTADVSYNVQQTLRVTVRDITQVSTVIASAVAAGANNIYNLMFGIADTKALEQQARELAVADARARADQLASLLGVTVGAPLMVAESFNVSPMPYGGDARALGVGGGGPVVQGGQLSVSISVSITYQIP